METGRIEPSFWKPRSAVIFSSPGQSVIRSIEAVSMRPSSWKGVGAIANVPAVLGVSLMWSPYSRSRAANVGFPYSGSPALRKRHCRGQERDDDAVGVLASDEGQIAILLRRQAALSKRLAA